MMLSRFTPLIASLALALGSAAAFGDTVSYKAPKPPLSPHAAVGAWIGKARVFVVYGRPYTNNPKSDKHEARTVWGGELVPYGKIWRTGADEATLLVTQKPLTLGSGAEAVKLEAGAYSLYTLPNSADDVKLIVNRHVGQWGLVYDKSADIGAVSLKRDQLDKPLHQFTIAVEHTSGAGGVLKLLWEDTQYSVPFTVGE